MVGTIVPIVNGSTARFRRLLPALLHAVASTAGAAAMGAALAVAGRASRRIVPQDKVVVMALLGGAALLVALHESGLVDLRLPISRRQVPAGWRESMHPTLAVTLYGLLLGPAFGTRLAVLTLYPVALYATLSSSPFEGAGVYALYGLARALPALFLAIDTQGQSRSIAVVMNLSPWGPVVHLVNGLALALTAGIFVLGAAS